MGLIGIGIPAFLAVAFSFCAHLCSSNYLTGFKRGVASSLLPSIPLGFVGSLFLTRTFEIPTSVVVFFTVVIALILSIFVSAVVGLLFMGDYKRLPGKR